MNTYLISGAGSGIGRSTAIYLSKRGHTLCLLGRREKALNDTLKQLDGDGHFVICADVRDREALLSAYAMMQKESLDGIIAASGVGGWSVWGEGDRWKEIIDTNLTGTYNLVNTFYPLLKRSPAPFKHITLITSAMARLGMPNFQALSASKAALHGLARCWATQWASEKILVNSICPGWVNTSMASDAIKNIAAVYSISADDALKLCMDSVPLRKMAEPEDVAQLIYYLISQTVMTGSVVDINGGMVMTG
jgi:NAD(P)-dependent dehydrogenase (short-subunit alcohol dehydrogenase family)